MEKTKRLIYLESVVGELAIFENDFIIIKRIDTKPTLKKLKVGGGYFNPKYEYYDELDVVTVWWGVVGDNSGRIYTFSSSPWYDWKRMIRDAAILIHQAEIYLNTKKGKNES